MKTDGKSTVTIAVIGAIIIILLFVTGAIWMGKEAKKDTEKAVRSVSLLYLDELAGRREQVVESNLKNRIQDIRIAIDLMDPSDLSDKSHLEAYQSRMKALYHLERFAFVDRDGLIYTSTGTQTNIEEFHFDYKTISEPEISILNLESMDKKVIIAVPVNIPFQDAIFNVCFMQIDMAEMLSGVSMSSDSTDATFCNIYTSNGIALSNTVLGGLAQEDNLLEALRFAEYENGYFYDKVVADFSEGRRGEVSFTYNGIRETLSYVPVDGTDWMLTYLIRESVISEEISSISDGIIRRSILQSLLTVMVLVVMFSLIISQMRKNSRLLLEKETAEAENRIKQQDLANQLALQEKLLEQEKQRTQQDAMITAMASDYRVVYHIDLEADEGICYRADPEDEEHTPVGVHFPYLERFTWYADHSVAESYREGFLNFIEPDNIREGLKKEPILAYRYLARRAGKEYYEMIRVADANTEEKKEGHITRTIGLGLTVIDAEMREALAQQKALSDALKAAEQANKAKTVFLSNMSHEIRTPMNAIIGLDNIALHDPDISVQTREYLEKIETSANHLLNIINDILDMSRIESGRMIIKSEDFSFSRMLEQVNTIISGQCRDKGLLYECHTKGKIDDFYVGDDMKLRQVLINILGNAVKFTPQGGKVSFLIENTAQFDGKTTLRFTIKDTGIGMSSDYLPHIFDAFSQEDSSTTNKYGSTGLGMPITRSIVEMMNGHIDVESEKNVGTTFVVVITLSESDQKAFEYKGMELQPHEMRVLVIDDDPIACEHAEVILGQVGINCDTAGTGEQGLNMVKMHHARREDYDLLLIDWKMPEMDGVETTRRIREVVGSDTPIIILTSYNWDEIADEARTAGVDTFVAKPLFAGNVIDQFREAFKRKNKSKSNPKADLKGRKILLAEDMSINAEIITMILNMREMEVDLAENGRIAVEKFTSHPEGYYDAILMDMRMPEMDGLEATRTIRAFDRPDSKTIPIIALTANAFDEDVQRSMQAGLNAHLSKPVQPDVLYETLESLIRD